MGYEQHESTSPIDNDVSMVDKAGTDTSPPQSVIVIGEARVGTATNSTVAGTLIEKTIINGSVQFIGPVTIIYEQEKVTVSPEELTQARTEYLKYVVATSTLLDWKGFAAHRKPKETPLDCIYVTLTTEFEVEQKPSDLSDARKVKSAAESRQLETCIEKAELYQAFTKHNRLVILGDPGAGKTTLTRFLSLRFAKAFLEGQSKVIDTDGNHFGLTLLPVRVTLSDFAKQWDNIPHPDFYSVLTDCARSKTKANAATIALLKTTLEQGAALILLDGLDEISDSDTRRRFALEIERIARDPSNKNRMLVTSRIAGYQETEGISGFTPYTLSELTSEQQMKFIWQWFVYYEPQLPHETDESGKHQRAEQKVQRLLADIYDNAGIGRFAANPLMLSLLCMISEPDSPLPTKRVELYERFSKTLLREWNKGKPNATERTIDEDAEEELIGPLAYAMQMQNENGRLSERDIIRRLCEILAPLRASKANSPAVKAEAKAFWKHLLEDTGLFGEYRFEQYGFIHLTFQEYYAARHIANDTTLALMTFPVYRTQARWEEVIRLTIASLSEDKAAYLVRTTLWHKDGAMADTGYQPSAYEEELRRDLFLAARCLSDCTTIEKSLAWEAAKELVAISLSRRAGYYDPLVERVREILVTMRNSEIGPKMVSCLLTWLTEEDREVRSEATKTLGMVGQESAEAVQGLLNALKDEYEFVRCEAAEALGKLGQKSARVVQDLVIALRDEYKYVRCDAAEALGKLGQGSPEAVKGLLAALKDEENAMRHHAAEAIGTAGMGSTEAITGLLEALNDENCDVRPEVAEALGKIGLGSAEALQGLLNACQSTDLRVRSEAQDAIETLEKGYVEWLSYLYSTLKEAAPEKRDEATHTIQAILNMISTVVDKEASSRVDILSSVAFGTEIVPYLLTALQENNDTIRATAAEALGIAGQGSMQAVQGLFTFACAEEGGDVAYASKTALEKACKGFDGAIQFLLTKLQDANENVRCTAIDILGSTEQGTNDVISALLSALQDENFIIQSAAARALGTSGVGSEEVVQGLLAALHDKSYFKCQILESLGKVGSGYKKAIHALIGGLDDESSSIKSRAAEGLGNIGVGDIESIRALISVLHDDTYYVRREAVKALGKIGHGSTEAVQGLLTALQDNDEWVRRAVAEALGTVGQHSEDAVQGLLTALQDESVKVRETAAAALGTAGQGSLNAVEGLLAALKDQPRYVRSEATKALIAATPGMAQAMPPLLIALKDENVEVQIAAASALGARGQDSTEAVPDLLVALKAKEYKIQIAAAEALGKIGLGTTEVIHALLTTLKDSTPGVQSAAWKSLSTIV